MLVKRLISWRNCTSHRLLCPQCGYPGHSHVPPEASLGEDGDGPFAHPLGRLEEAALHCPEHCSDEMTLDFRASLTLTV